MSNLTTPPYVGAATLNVKSSRPAQPVLLLGNNRTPVGAKTYHLLNGRVTQRAFRFPDLYDIVTTATPTTFDEMVEMLRKLMETPSVHFTFGRVRAGANLKALRRKQAGGESGGDIEDAPVSVLPIDTEAILLAGGVDPKDDPEGAAELAYRILTDAVPELEGAPCAVTFSNSAGFGSFDVEDGKPKVIDTIRAHLWFFLDEPAYPSQIKARFERANATAREFHGHRLNNDLIDTSVYAPAKLIFTADPLIGQGVRDPIPSGERLQVIKGDADWVVLDVAPVEADTGEEGRASGGQFVPNPDLLRDEDRAARKLIEIATKMANPDVAWESYARVMGLLRNFGHVYGIRQSVVREAVHIWSAKSGKYDHAETENLLRSWGRNQMTRVGLGELLALERWSETDDAIYAETLADYRQRMGAKHKAKLKPLAVGQGISRRNTVDQETLNRRSMVYYEKLFGAYDLLRRYDVEYNSQLQTMRDLRDEKGWDEEEWHRHVRRIRAENPELTSQDVIARVRGIMMAAERRKAHKAAQEALAGAGVGEKGQIKVRLRKAIRRLLRWSAGTGKTTLFAAQYASNERMRGSDYVNAYFHDTAAAERFIKEVFDAVAAAGVSRDDVNVQLIVGRTNTSRSSSPDTPCRRPDAAKAVGEAGENVYSSICRRLTGFAPDGEPVYDYCPFYPKDGNASACEFGSFFQNKRPGLRVFVHQNLTSFQPGDWQLPKPNLVLVDESFLSALRETQVIPVEWLWHEAAYIVETDLDAEEIAAITGDESNGASAPKQTARQRKEIVKAITDLRLALEGQTELGLLKLDQLVAGGLGDTLDLLIEASRKVAKSSGKLRVRPSMSDVDILAAVNGTGGYSAKKVVRVLERLKSDMDNLAGVGRSNSLWLDDDRMIRLETRKKLPLRPNTSVLVIDADGNVDFARKVFGPELIENVLRGERLGTVVQNFEGERSKSYMTRLLCVEVVEQYCERVCCTPREAFGEPEVQAEIARRMKRSGYADAFYHDLRDTVRKQVALGMRVLISAPKAVREAMAAYAKLFGGDTEGDLMASVPFQQKVSENWFGARLTHPPVFVGSNEFRDFHAIHIVSREQPPLDAMKSLAGAFFHDDPTLDLDSDSQMVLRPYGLKNLNDVEVEVRIHGDERVQYLMELSRELKILQAIDRLRLLRLNPDRLLDGTIFTPRVYIHTNLPLDGLEVDQLVGGHEMRTYGGSPWAAALARPEGVLPVGVIPLTPSWCFKHAGLKNAEGGAMPLSTVKALVAKMREEPHRAPDGAAVVRLRLIDGLGKEEPISALVSREVFLSRPKMVPTLVAIALAHENGFSGELPFVDWRRETHDRIDFGKPETVEVVDEATGEVQTSTTWSGGMGYLGASLGYGALPSVANEALYLVTGRPTVPKTPKVSPTARSAQKNPLPSFYKQTEPSATLGTVGGTVGTVGSVSAKATTYPDDLLDAQLAAGVVVPRGAKGYAELVGAVVGVKPKTIRNAASANAELKARWDAEVSVEGCTHRVTMKGGTFSIPARVTDDGALDRGVELLIELDCTVEPI